MSQSDGPASEVNFERVDEGDEQQERVDGIVGGTGAGLPGGASEAGHENDDLPASESNDDASETES